MSLKQTEVIKGLRNGGGKQWDRNEKQMAEKKNPKEMKLTQNIAHSRLLWEHKPTVVTPKMNILSLLAYTYVVPNP